MKKTNFKKLKKRLPKIKENISLAKYTTFKIGGPARYFFIAKNKEDLIKAIKTAKEFKLSFFNSRLNIHTLANQGSAERSDSGARQVLILGGGSNVLFSDKGFDGLAIKLQASSFKLQGSNIYTEAGTKLEDLVKLSAKRSFTGLEWAVGIPGTIGGAIYGNAQAFGIKISNIVKSVEVLDAKTLNPHTKQGQPAEGGKIGEASPCSGVGVKIGNFSRKQCHFSSKNSIFKKNKNFIIISAILKLKKGNKKEIQEKIKEHLDYRRKRHPLKFSSAGCVFQNPKFHPPKFSKKIWVGKQIKNQKLLKKFPELKKFNEKGMIPAAFLIEKCGLKGKKIGKAGISKKHANFIVNLGGAKAKDVLKLMKLAKQKVKTKFGIALEEEIKIISPC